jgi:glutamate-1-semialdehyde 2,1-aminomutase
MTTRDYSRLMSEISEAFQRRFPTSAALQRDACRNLVDGGSHSLRLIQPFPPRITAAQGGWIRDEDGHDLLDFWQGHLANVLGHNPEVVTSELARCFGDRFGLQVGMTDRLQAEVAEILCRRTGAERVRLTTSGTLAGMYGVMLARAFTGRDLVLKVGGGWHGAQPWSLKGFKFHAENGGGFAGVDSEGLPAAVTDNVIVTSFNDPERLREDFERYGDRLACFIVEPLIGGGGTVPATREYLETARRLTHEHGALLIFDEVVCGFRFRAGNLAALYGVDPDLAVYGKAIGGGMPVAALAGRDDVMKLIGRAQGSRVAVLGGTYCAHPASMVAAKTSMNYLVEHEGEVYPRLADLGEKMRDAMTSGFADEGIFTLCTGHGPNLPCGSSLAMVHFPYREDAVLDTPEAVNDPAVCDVVLRSQVLGPAMLLEDVHLVMGHGSAATSHTDDDMELLKDACRKVARRIKPYFNTGPSGR